tara:strand:- start:166 stop:372 length:207 start_codon:yes stop_codon:yes gene_type:complete
LNKDNEHRSDIEEIDNLQGRIHANFLRKKEKSISEWIGDKKFFETNRPTAFKKFNVKRSSEKKKRKTI